MENKVKCGNCGELIDVTGDNVKNYEAFIAHKNICPKAAAAAEQSEQLIADYKKEQSRRRRLEQKAAKEKATAPAA